MHLRDFRIVLIALMLTIICTSCDDEASINNRYSSYPAYFCFSPVSSISQLNSSCNSLGEWCTITCSNKILYFTKESGSTGQANLVALQYYSRFDMGFSGFIVGLPSIPEMGYDNSVVTCYDLACSNCHTDGKGAKKMTLKSGGYAYCSKCGRTYDLNNQGIISSGDAGINLYRYRIYYIGDNLSITN